MFPSPFIGKAYTVVQKSETTSEKNIILEYILYNIILLQIHTHTLNIFITLICMIIYKLACNVIFLLH